MADLGSIRTFHPRQGWWQLQEWLDELEEPSATTRDAILELFERFPVGDLDAWASAIHHLERCPDYELALLASLQRQPSEAGLRAARRRV
ncbi:MAG: hypothetical protein AB1758_37670, partial [Candidatus Eremiobacterota bacterium]